MKRLLLALLFLPCALAVAETPDAPIGVTTVAPTPAPKGWSRWLAIDTLSGSMRYRNTMNDVGVHMFDFGQHREILDGRFRFDAAGRYAVAFHLSSGRYFNWAYADTIGGQFSDTVPPTLARLPLAELERIGHAVAVDPDGLTYAAGIQSRGGYIYVRQLYLRATPVQAVTVEFGSLPIEHGVNTEITSFDDDGYIAGERFRVHAPGKLYFDELDATFAYMGDAFTPNFFARGDRLTQNNYQQYLAEKRLGSRAVASADYTHLRASHTLREAVKLDVPELHWVDSARVELYQRVNGVVYYGVPAAAGAGAAGSVSKTVAKRAQVEIGFASIDDNYASYSGSPFLEAVGLSWNSDSFVNGKRAFTKVDWKLAPGFHLTGMYNHKTAEGGYSINHQSLNGGFVFDAAELLHRRAGS